MAFENKRLIVASVAVANILAFGMITVAVTYFPSEATFHSHTSGISSSNTSGLQSFQSTIAQQTATSESSTLLGTTVSASIDPANCHGNCALNLQWPEVATYDTMSDLVNASGYVGLANVTSVSTENVSGVPVLLYNVTVIQNIIQNQYAGPGTNLTVAQIGGTVNGTTMQVQGYPRLVVGDTYVFFLELTETFLIQYYQLNLITVGGPQGLFYVQNGNVFSLNNMYPQADSWLPVKADGVPLAQFIQEVQSATTSTTTTSTSTTSTVSSSSAVQG